MRVFLAGWIGDVPPLRQKSDYVRGVSADRNFRSRTGSGEVGALSIRVKKQLWRQAYAEQRSVVYKPPSVRRQSRASAFVIWIC